jgi:hypothetical protein
MLQAAQLIFYKCLRDGRISLFGNFVYLPLLHRLVEERVGVRRFVRRVPLSLSLSPLGGARERYPTISKQFAKK